jgi:hypothetical protein
MNAQTASAVAAAISAIAAATSAWFSRRAVERTHAPFIWPAISIRSAGGSNSRQHEVGVRLHNDGSGAAFNVRFAIATDESLASPEALYVVPPVRAIRSGESVPPYGSEDQLAEDGEYRVALIEPLDANWCVVVRYADGLGRFWQLRAPSDPHSDIHGQSVFAGGDGRHGDPAVIGERKVGRSYGADF